MYIFICITNIDKVCAQNLSGYLWIVGFFPVYITKLGDIL